MNPADDTPDAGSRTAEPGKARANKRESLFLGVEIERKTSRLSGRIRNISANGALLEADIHFGVGESLVLTFRGVTSIGATVVRKTLRGVGVRFDEEIDPAVCRLSVVSDRELAPAWLPPPSTPRFKQPYSAGRPRR
jgi:hypothetical protein